MCWTHSLSKYFPFGSWNNVNRSFINFVNAYDFILAFRNIYVSIFIVFEIYLFILKSKQRASRTTGHALNCITNHNTVFNMWAVKKTATGTDRKSFLCHLYMAPLMRWSPGSLMIGSAVSVCSIYQRATGVQMDEQSEARIRVITYLTRVTRYNCGPKKNTVGH